MDHIIREDVKKQPTNLKTFPTTPEPQLGLTLYSLAHGCSFSTVADLLGISISLAGQTFNKVSRVLVAQCTIQLLYYQKIKQNGKLNLKTS